jgi:hypothetical protein
MLKRIFGIEQYALPEYCDNAYSVCEYTKEPMSGTFYEHQFLKFVKVWFTSNNKAESERMLDIIQQGYNLGLEDAKNI